MSDLQALRAAYRSGKEALLAGAQTPGFSARSVHKVLRQLAAQADGLLIELWKQTQTRRTKRTSGRYKGIGTGPQIILDV